MLAGESSPIPPFYASLNNSRLGSGRLAQIRQIREGERAEDTRTEAFHQDDETVESINLEENRPSLPTSPRII